MIIGGKRNCGKSTELIKISSINNIPIIVLNDKRRAELEYLAKENDIKIPKPIRFEDCKYDMRGRNINEILIDDIEDILSSLLFPTRIVGMTTSIPFHPLEKINKENKKRVHHVSAPVEKVKELILENNKGYMNLRLKEKIIIVKHFAHFDNDTELLEFLEYMED